MAYRKKIGSKLSTYYYVDIRVGDKTDPNRIWINRSTKTADYGEACQIEEEWRVKAEEQYLSAHEDPEGDTLEMTLKSALDHVYKNRWRHNRTGYKPVQHIEKVIELTGDIPIKNFSGKQGAGLISRLRNDLLGLDNGRGRVINKETVDRYMSSIKTLLFDIRQDFHLQDELIIPYIRMFNVKNARSRVLSYVEEIKLFKLMNKSDPDFAKLCRVLLDTGMRLSEALKMRYDHDIYFREKKITLLGRMTKNGKIKSIPMTRSVFEILRKRQTLGNQRPFPWRADVCAHKFAKYRDQMGLSDESEFVLHMLRHTCTTRLLQQGVSQVIVQTWLGHSDAKMTTHYSHLVVEDMRDGAEVLDKLTAEIHGISVRKGEKIQLPTMDQVTKPELRPTP